MVEDTQRMRLWGSAYRDLKSAIVILFKLRLRQPPCDLYKETK